MADDAVPSSDTQAAEDAAPEKAAAKQPYAVFARKYRPQTFDDLVGQDALVRTLTNAIDSGRLHHAFVLTGVRGVGKTTTARIVARALNCVGPDGKGDPTPRPCGQCANCVAIAQDRHVDVIEIDAASRTGIDDVREIIDGVRYAPVQARFKVYIVDEVHMFSKQAFNGLLKTLEEPPPHVKFIFATTEIRKVPITVLSRCQRFDLRRLDMAELIGLLRHVLREEGVEADDEAVALIARAADGSARDGLSLLDQAVAQGGGSVAVDAVRAMLGLADRTVVLDLFQAIMTGATQDALGTLEALHKAGAEPLVVLQDLLDLTHFLTRAKLVPGALDEPGVPEAERTQGRALADQLTMAALTRAWQMLLKGLSEVQMAPVPAQALEMVVIRLMHAGTLPTPADLARMVTDGGGAGGGSGGGTGAGGGAAPPSGGGGASAQSVGPTAVSQAAPRAWSGNAQQAGGGQAARALNLVASADPQEAAAELDRVSENAPEPAPEEAPEIVPEGTPPAMAMPGTFEQLASLFEQRADGYLLHYFYSEVFPVKVAAGHLEFRPGPNAPTDLAARIARALEDWTGQRWTVAVSNQPGGPSLREREASAQEAARQAALAHPVVKAVMQHFPDATLEAIHTLGPDPAALPDEGVAPDDGLLDSDGADDEITADDDDVSGRG